MKQLHFFLYFLIISPLCLFGQEQTQWAERWVEGLGHYQKKEFNQAVEKYTSALNSVDIIDIHPYIRYDRARAYHFSGQQKKAIEDFTYVIGHSKPTSRRFQAALVGRSVAYAMSGDMEKSKADSDRVEKVLSGPFASTDNSGYRIMDIGPAIGLDDLAKKAYINSLIFTGLCESEKDVIFSPSGVVLVKRRNAD